MKRFMLGDYDDNFYFNNPVDYMSNMSDGWAMHHLASCDIHLATGTGPWEHPAESYRLSGFSPAAACATASTTGARRAGTTGPTGAT